MVGKHCESGDIVGARRLGDLRLPGICLAVAATGAYCYSMSSRYNMVMRPAWWWPCADGASRLLIRRETIEDFQTEVRQK